MAGKQIDLSFNIDNSITGILHDLWKISRHDGKDWQNISLLPSGKVAWRYLII